MSVYEVPRHKMRRYMREKNIYANVKAFDTNPTFTEKMENILVKHISMSEESLFGLTIKDFWRGRKIWTGPPNKEKRIAATKWFY